jgi:hypothetical protein
MYWVNASIAARRRVQVWTTQAGADIYELTQVTFSSGRVVLLSERDLLEHVLNVKGRFDCAGWRYQVRLKVHRTERAVVLTKAYSSYFMRHALPTACLDAGCIQEGQATCSTEGAGNVAAWLLGACEDNREKGSFTAFLLHACPEIGRLPLIHETCNDQFALHRIRADLVRIVYLCPKTFSDINYLHWYNGVPPAHEHEYADRGKVHYRTALRISGLDPRTPPGWRLVAEYQSEYERALVDPRSGESRLVRIPQKFECVFRFNGMYRGEGLFFGRTREQLNAKAIKHGKKQKSAQVRVDHPTPPD